MRSVTAALLGVALVLGLAAGLIVLRPTGTCGLNKVMKGLDSPVVDDLQWAASSGRVLCVKRILAERPDLINRRGFDGWTPLHEAARGGYDAVVRLLIRQGANVNARNGEGETAFDCAVRAGCRTTAKLLMTG